jgi:hypothetical protein
MQLPLIYSHDKSELSYLADLGFIKELRIYKKPAGKYYSPKRRYYLSRELSYSLKENPFLIILDLFIGKIYHPRHIVV